jgi:hypothetical protein
MKKIKIAKQSYYYECGDGCCSEFETRWYLDGELVSSTPCEDTNLVNLLKALGFEVELVGLDENKEEIWEL